jgi:O-antigen/teichoic acid export membrane protein
MMVLMSEKIREGRNRAVILLWHETTRKLALVFFPLVGLLIVTARDLIAFLFTENYLASVPVFMIWSFTVVLSALQTDGILRVFAATRFLLFVNIVRLSIVAGLISVAISRFGLIGAVLVTVLGMAIAKSLSLAKIRTLLAVPASQLLPWRTLAAIAAVAVAACAGPLAIQSTMRLAAFPLLAISGFAYAALYLALLLRVKLLNESERSALLGWLRPIAVPALRAARIEGVEGVRHRRNLELEG